MRYRGKSLGGMGFRVQGSYDILPPEQALRSEPQAWATRYASALVMLNAFNKLGSLNAEQMQAKSLFTSSCSAKQQARDGLDEFNCPLHGYNFATHSGGGDCPSNFVTVVVVVTATATMKNKILLAINTIKLLSPYFRQGGDQCG